MRHIVKKVLEREPSAEFDLAVEFDTLRDYDFLEDWFGQLEWDRKIPRDYTRWAFDHALEELEEKADYLDRVVVQKFEYDRFLRLDERYGKLDRKLSERENKRQTGRLCNIESFYSSYAYPFVVSHCHLVSSGSILF